MTLQEKLEYFKNKGFTYNSITGSIYDNYNIEIKSNSYIKLQKYINTRLSIMVRGHQFAWFMFYNEVPTIIDHINRIKNDNRISNLRIVTKQENGFNTNSKGYSYDKKRKKYHSKIHINGKCIHLGRYDTDIEAHQAYLEAKKIHHKI